MNDRVRILGASEAFDDETWHRLSSLDPEARFTQSPVWTKLGVEELAWKVSCALWQSTNIIIPFIVTAERFGKPVRIESMPWGMAGGPLIEPSSVRDITPVFNTTLSRLAPEVIMYPTTRLGLPGWDEMNHVVHEVEIPADNPSDWGFAHRKCRTAARHALKKGIRIQRIQDESHLHEVIQLHNAQQRSRNARTYPRSWWRKLVREGKANCGLWGAFHNGHVIAALLIGWWNENAVALVSTSDPVSRPLKAGNLLYLSVFEHLGINGIRTVDLGGSRGKKSLEAFKESLGAKTKIRYWYRHRHRMYRMYRTLTGLVRR